MTQTTNQIITQQQKEAIIKLWKHLDDEGTPILLQIIADTAKAEKDRIVAKLMTTNSADLIEVIKNL